jgi:hypothetical protein
MVIKVLGGPCRCGKGCDGGGMGPGIEYPALPYEPMISRTITPDKMDVAYSMLRN